MSTTTTFDDTVAAIEDGPEGPSTLAIFDVDRAVVAGTLTGAFGADVTAFVRSWRGKEEAELEKHAARVFAKKVADNVYAEARELVASHRGKGHTILLASTATRHQAGPVAEALGIDDVVCTEAEVRDGRLTAELAGPVCADDAMASAVKSFAAGHGVDLGQSHVYAGEDGSL